MPELTLYYFNGRARGQLPLLVALYAGINMKWVNDMDNSWPGTLKAEAPFGQLPFIVDGDLKIGQSMAISRYLARKGNLLGESDDEFAASEQFVEEQNDLYNILAGAQYAPGDKAAAWKKAEEVQLPAHLERLEKLLGDKDYFSGKVLLGDLAIFSVFNLIRDVFPNVLDNYPKLKAFYDRLASQPNVVKFLETSNQVYFKKD